MIERIDDTGFGGIKVIQSKGLGYGVDAVLLASFASGETGARGLPESVPGAVTLLKNRADDPDAEDRQNADAPSLRIADLGTGCGVVAFILHHKLCSIHTVQDTQAAARSADMQETTRSADIQEGARSADTRPSAHGLIRITGFDINPDAIGRAARACKINGLEADIDFICCDIKDIIKGIDSEAVGGSSIKSGSISESGAVSRFDAVVTNPPYFRRTPDEPGAADPDERYIARHETTAGIRDFARVSAAMLRDGGSLYMVHRPDRLADIFTEMRSAGIEPKEMQLVVPSAGKTANMVLIHGIKGAGPELRLLPEIAVHTADGGYTKEILEYYERT